MIEQNEQIYMVDTDYTPNPMPMYESVHETLTGCFITFLREKGLTVHRALAPVVMYEHQSILMLSYKLDNNMDMDLLFDRAYEQIMIMRPQAVIVYHIMEQYNWSQEMDEQFQPIGDKHLTKNRTLRFGIYKDNSRT